MAGNKRVEYERSKQNKQFDSALEQVKRNIPQ